MSQHIIEKDCGYVRVFVDGACREDKMGIGVIAYVGDTDQMYRSYHAQIETVEGVLNHYVAEWAAVVIALKVCRAIPGLKVLKVFNDNLTVMNQLNGKARIRKHHLVVQDNEAKQVLALMEDVKVTFHHVKKRYNNHADALSQRAIDDANTPLINVFEFKEDIKKTAPEPEKKEMPEDRAEALKNIEAFIDERKKERADVMEDSEEEVKEKTRKPFEGLDW